MAYDKEHEKLSMRVGEALLGVCPALVREDKENTHKEWHRWRCRIDGSACSCVWHVMGHCSQGEWKHLGFAKEYNDKRLTKRRAIASQVKEAMSRVYNEFEKIENRSQILDL